MAPGSRLGKEELSTSRMPIFEFSGHCASLRVPKWACAAVQALLPSAALELTLKPGGSDDGQVADRRGSQRAGAQFLGHGEVDVEARGRVGLGRRRLRAQARVEAELIAAGHRRIGFGQLFGFVVIADDVARDRQRPAAAGRVVEQGRHGGVARRRRVAGGAERRFGEQRMMMSGKVPGQLASLLAESRSALCR